MFKNELGGKIVSQFAALRENPYAYLMKDGSEHKRAKETKNCIIKRALMFNHYKESLFDNKIVLKSQQRFRSDFHDVYTEKINKIALCSNDDKRIQTFDKITKYPYGTNVFKVPENEMINVCNVKETLWKIREESEGELCVTCSIFFNYMKRKFTTEMKRHVKLPKKRCKI